MALLIIGILMIVLGFGLALYGAYLRGVDSVRH